MAKESACVFPLLGSKLKELKRDCRRLIWSKHHCILSSLASNSPFTWPTTRLESKNKFTAFLPSF